MAISFSVTVKAQGIRQKLLMACHYVGEVAQALRCMPLGSDVDVHSALSCCVTFCPGLSEGSYQSLQGFDVTVGKDWSNQFALLMFRAEDAGVPLEFPFPSVW